MLRLKFWALFHVPFIIPVHVSKLLFTQITEYKNIHTFYFKYFLSENSVFTEYYRQWSD